MHTTFHTISILLQNIEEMTQHLLFSECPPGAPVAMCSADPCQGQSCAGHPDAVCKPSFCGGCFAKFYNTSGKEIVCTTRGIHCMMEDNFYLFII